MFNNFDATLSTASFKARTSKGEVRRSCELTLETDFTDDLSDGLGEDANRWRADLKSGSLEQAKIPISAVACKCFFETPDGEEHTVPLARGISAIGVMADHEDAIPRIKIKIAFQLRHDDAAWFPMQLGNVVMVRFERVQLSLVDGESEAETRLQGAVAKAKKAGMTVTTGAGSSVH